MCSVEQWLTKGEDQRSPTLLEKINELPGFGKRVWERKDSMSLALEGSFCVKVNNLTLVVKVGKCTFDCRTWELRL